MTATPVSLTYFDTLHFPAISPVIRGSSLLVLLAKTSERQLRTNASYLLSHIVLVLRELVPLQSLVYFGMLRAFHY